MPLEEAKWHDQDAGLSKIKDEIKSILDDHGLGIKREESTRIQAERETSIIVSLAGKSPGWTVEVRSNDSDLIDAIISRAKGERTRTVEQTETVERGDGRARNVSVSMEISEDGEVTVDRDGVTERLSMEVGVIAGDSTVSDGPSVIMFDDNFNWTPSQIDEFIDDLAQEMREKSR